MKIADRDLDELDAFERRLRAGLDSIAATTPMHGPAEFDPASSPLAWPTPGPRRLMPVAAAAAITAVGVAGVAVYGLRDPSSPVSPPPAASQPTTNSPTSTVAVSADALLSQAVATSAQALVDSGRITVTNTVVASYSDTNVSHSSPSTMVHATSMIFSGDDWEITVGNAINRYVGGALFTWLPDGDGSESWTQDPDDTGGRGSSAVTNDPSNLFTTLDPVAGFTVAGPGTVDGDAVTVLVAAAPGNVDGATVGDAGLIGAVDDVRTTTLTGIEVSVDATNLVRQIKLTGTTSSDATGLNGEALTWTEQFDATVALGDFGQPFTIETPTDVQIVDANG